MIVFFDSQCSFCMRRAEELVDMDKRRRLIFEDINDPGIILESYGLNYDDAIETIHVFDENTNEGPWSGIDAVIKIYETLEFRRAKWLKLPIIYQIAKFAYKIVNKVRKYL